MSTPTGKPAGEDTGSSRKPEDGADAARSPYAPKRSRLRAVPSEPADGNTVDLPRFLVAADRTRSQPVEPPRPAANANDSLLRFDEPQRPRTSEKGEEPKPSEPKSEVKASEPKPAEPKPAEIKAGEVKSTETKPSEPKPKLTLAREATPTPARADSPRKEGEGDIERLEASLRWLKHQTEELHPPQPTVAPGRRSGEAHTADVAADQGTLAPRSLEPQNLMGPALMRAQRSSARGTFATLRGPLLILIAGLVAAPVAYFLSGSSSRAPAPEPTRASKLAAIEQPPAVVAPQVVAPRQEPAPVAVEPASNEPAASTTDVPAAPVAAAPAPAAPARAAAPDASTTSAKAAKAAAPKPSAPTETVVAALPPSRSEPAPAPAVAATAMPEPVRAAPAAPPVRRLEPTEIKLLMQQGQQFISAGDVVAARVVFQRAAEAQDAGAALAMGATYDPTFLSKMGVLGVAADIQKARGWYEKAKAFGSQEAPRRLEMLANR